MHATLQAVQDVVDAVMTGQAAAAGGAAGLVRLSESKAPVLQLDQAVSIAGALSVLAQGVLWVR